MAICLEIVAGALVEVAGATELTCTAYLLTTATEYRSFDLRAIFAEYFQFDLTLSELIMTSMLVAFISGHVLGRVISGLRKAG